ncbi:hypothetical protein I7I53_10491 [Histoplasma capsulatum var. duboisii H88]|uniref:Uncharacterized protein n=1 Tax=Ajellomyces capsulatus (strain H88) TaxID=544711 RepID=A0A8A1LBB3_AJEC8|nr:hypothetical protein I7I53_10491 [Histoplasma capsulatum var. duboisii H88]
MNPNVEVEKREGNKKVKREQENEITRALGRMNLILTIYIMQHMGSPSFLSPAEKTCTVQDDIPDKLTHIPESP